MTDRDHLRNTVFAPTIDKTTAPLAEKPAQCAEGFTFFPFQLQSLKRMQEIEAAPSPTVPHMKCRSCESHVGVLANKPGSGKSTVAIALCCSPCPTKNNLTLVSSNGFRQKYFFPHQREPQPPQEVNCNLIVVPPKVLDQWVGYMSSYRDLPYQIIRNLYSVPANLQDMLQLARNNRILFIGSNTLGKIRNFLSRIRFDRIFFDEVQDMTYRDCQSTDIYCNFMWFISATPEFFLTTPNRANGRSTGSELPNNFREYLRGAFDFSDLDYHTSRYFVVRCSNEHIDFCMNLPKYTLEVIGVPPSAAVRLVHGVVENREFANLVHADRIQEAIQVLNINDQTIETLQTAVETWLDNRINNVKAELAYSVTLGVQPAADREERRQQTIEKFTSELKELEAKKITLLQRVQSSTDCPICLGDLENPVALKCCLKTFCFSCLRDWIPRKPSCPHCRHPIDSTQDLLHMVNKKRKGSNLKRKCKSTPTAAAVEDDDEEEEEEEEAQEAEEKAEDRPRNKIEAMLKIMATTNKALIYITDDGDDRAQVIKDRLTDQGIRVFSLLRLTSVGASHTIRAFQDTEHKACLVVNCFQHSAGFNLQFVDTIIMYQKMMSYETQIIGRGMRPGRTEPLRVYRLQYDNSLA